jgi:hypothetical protein
MTLEEFDKLEKNERYQTLWDNGVVIAERRDLDCKYYLYQLDGFYIELGYDFGFNRIIGLITFSDTDKLEPYLKSIIIEWQ